MQKEIIDKIALLHIKNKKIFMAKSYGREVFYTPGGKREGNYSDYNIIGQCDQTIFDDLKTKGLVE